jgi:signal transduction histidine kinase
VSGRGPRGRDIAALCKANAELARANADLEERLVRRISEYAVARERAVTELARTDAELAQRLAERTLERDGAARAEALSELDRTNAELAFRLAERTIERDDVAREEAVAELLRTNAELKQRLAKRTLERDTVARVEAAVELVRTDAAELQSRLHAAELEALNAELESFSYSVSHDLRSPVRAVLGYSRALEEDYGAVLDDEGRRLLSVVSREATRMGHLIDDLLAFSQLGRKPIVRTLVDVATLVEEVVAEQSALAGRGPSIFSVAALPGVSGDRALLRQVWTNLISNALKYSSNNAAPTIRIWAVAEASRIVYNVCDDGVGFDMAYASKLFGVFQRLHRSEDFAGTGVGLAIAHGIVQRHGGTIWADAALGAGATFSFALPMGAAE